MRLRRFFFTQQHVCSRLQLWLTQVCKYELCHSRHEFGLSRSKYSKLSPLTTSILLKTQLKCQYSMQQIENSFPKSFSSTEKSDEEIAMNNLRVLVVSTYSCWKNLIFPEGEELMSIIRPSFHPIFLPLDGRASIEKTASKRASHTHFTRHT